MPDTEAKGFPKDSTNLIPSFARLGEQIPDELEPFGHLPRLPSERVELASLLIGLFDCVAHVELG